MSIENSEALLSLVVSYFQFEGDLNNPNSTLYVNTPDNKFSRQDITPAMHLRAFLQREKIRFEEIPNNKDAHIKFQILAGEDSNKFYKVLVDFYDRTRAQRLPHTSGFAKSSELASHVLHEIFTQYLQKDRAVQPPTRHEKDVRFIADLSAALESEGTAKFLADALAKITASTARKSVLEVSGV